MSRGGGGGAPPHPSASALYIEAFAAGTTYTRVVREALALTEGRGISRFAVDLRKANHARVTQSLARPPMLQALETGRCVIAGTLPELEVAMNQWQAGQKKVRPAGRRGHCVRRAGARGRPADCVRHAAGPPGPPAAGMVDTQCWWVDRSRIGRPEAAAASAASRARSLARSAEGGGYDPLLAYLQTDHGETRSRDVSRPSRCPLKLAHSLSPLPSGSM